MKNLIAPERLAELLDDPNLRIVDTRFDLKAPEAGLAAYESGHVPGAIYFDLDEDLSSPPSRGAGRHPLPDMESFARKLAIRGIGNEHLVVVYDDSNGLFAGRMWWLLRYAGHDQVKLLDGGLSAWVAMGGAVTAAVPTYPRAEFDLDLRPEMAVDKAFVARNLDNPEVLLIDARAPERYRGEIEPLDPQAGHIPSAVNRPFAENLEGGRFLSRDALRARYVVAEEAEDVVVYCGSGVSAAHDVLAMEEAGLPLPKLYVGSWSQWSGDPEAPVATGSEEDDA
jgi:thiosulfate/3-mercaptopyruvate sulfurtransferase